MINRQLKHVFTLKLLTCCTLMSYGCDEESLDFLTRETFLFRNNGDLVRSANPDQKFVGRHMRIFFTDPQDLNTIVNTQNYYIHHPRPFFTMSLWKNHGEEDRLYLTNVIEVGIGTSAAVLDTDIQCMLYMRSYHFLHLQEEDRGKFNAQSDGVYKQNQHDSFLRLSNDQNPQRIEVELNESIRTHQIVWNVSLEGVIQDSHLNDLAYHVGYNRLLKKFDLLPIWSLTLPQKKKLEGMLAHRRTQDITTESLKLPYYVSNFNFSLFFNNTHPVEIEMRDKVGKLHALKGEAYDHLGGGNRMHLIVSYEGAPDEDWIWSVKSLGKIYTIVVTEKQRSLEPCDISSGLNLTLLGHLIQNGFCNASYVRALLQDEYLTYQVHASIQERVVQNRRSSQRDYERSAELYAPFYKRLSQFEERYTGDGEENRLKIPSYISSKEADHIVPGRYIISLNPQAEIEIYIEGVESKTLWEAIQNHPQCHYANVYKIKQMRDLNTFLIRNEAGELSFYNNAAIEERRKVWVFEKMGYKVCRIIYAPTLEAVGGAPHYLNLKNNRFILQDDAVDFNFEKVE